MSLLHAMHNDDTSPPVFRCLGPRRLCPGVVCHGASSLEATPGVGLLHVQAPEPIPPVPGGSGVSSGAKSGSRSSLRSFWGGVLQDGMPLGLEDAPRPCP